MLLGHLNVLILSFLQYPERVPYQKRLLQVLDTLLRLVKPETMERAPRRAREIDANTLQRQMADNKKLNDQLKALQEEISAKKKESQAKLNERDDNQKRLEMKVDELNDTIKELAEVHQTEMEIQKATTKELEKQANKHKEELILAQNDYKRTLAESNQKHQKELAAQREQARKLELKYRTELKQQRDGYLMDHGSPDHSPEQVRREANVAMEIEQQDQIQQKIANLKQENDFLKTQLTDQQQRARYLHSELDYQTELYGQLQVQVVAKQQLAAVPTIKDVSYIQTCSSFLAYYCTYMYLPLGTVEHSVYSCVSIVHACSCTIIINT